MNRDEYYEKLQQIEKEYALKKDDLSVNFAKSNNPYKIGDIIRDHYEIIRIDKIGTGCFHRETYPSCVYDGILVTKKGIPFKNGKRGTVYQDNVKEQIV